MRLFTFNSKSNNTSNNKSWYLTWLLFTLICVLTLTAYELFLKNRGYIASIENNKDLWSWYRYNATGSNNKLVIIGASRSQLDIDIPYLKKKLSSYDIIQLSINAQYPVATLKALANDESFTGTLIVSISAQAVESQYADMQQQHNTYYLKNASVDKSLNAYIMAFLQSKLRFLHPLLGLEEVVKFYDIHKRFQDPSYTTANLDQSISADYSKTDTTKLQDFFYIQKKKNYEEATPTEPQLWMKNISLMDKYIATIEKRGGTVVVIRFPTDKRHWQLDEQFYPRRNYWDMINKKHSIKTVHFNDVDGLNSFDLPDSSHLDQDDSTEFTEILFNYLLEKNFIATGKKNG